MISVLIVEDEIIIAKGLAHLITQNYPDFQVVGIARNGQDGLKMALKMRPNLIFSDINMPAMSGLEMLTQIQQVGVSSRYVILSGYADFEYARTAMLMGITDYLLKPITPDTLRPIMLSTRSHYQTELRLLQTDYLQRNLKKPLEPEGSNPLSDYTCTLFLAVSGPLYGNVYAESLNGIATPTLNPDVLKELENQYQITLIPLHGRHQNEYLCAVISHPGQKVPLEELIAQIQPHLQSDTAYLNLLISQKIEQGLDIYAISKELYLYALVHTPFGRSGTYFCHAIPDQKVLVSQEIKQICSSIPPEPALDTLHDFIHTMRSFWEKNAVTQFQLTTDLRYFFNTLLHAYLKDMMFFPDVNEIIASSNSYSDLESILRYELEQICQPQTNSSQQSMANQIRDWLDLNFTTQLSYKILSDVFGHNEKYLSVIFKSEFGISPSKYIGELRLNMAKKLIQTNPNILLKDVAEMVGFTDVFYFSRTFKSHEGISPKQYAQQQKDLSKGKI